MPRFQYTTRDAMGGLVKRIARATSEADFRDLLDRLGYEIISLAQYRTLGERLREDYFAKYQKPSRQEVILFIKQLATMVRSGLPILRALESVYDQTEEPFRSEVGKINECLRGGRSLSEALGTLPHLFSIIEVNMVRAGEASGMLDQSLEQLAELGMNEMEIKTKVRSAIMYPAVVLLIALSMVVFLLVKVVPDISAIFAKKGADLPLSTDLLLFISNTLTSFWWAIIAVIVAAVVGFRNYVKQEKGRLVVDNLILNLPLFGPLLLKVMVARYTRVLGSLVKSGVPITEALEITGGLMTNKVLYKINQEVLQAVIRGLPLSDVFQASGIFPIMVVQMVRVGEESGNMDGMLFQVADFYELQADYTIRNLTSLLEPIILIGVGAVVGFIAFSILLPIFKMSQLVKGG